MRPPCAGSKWDGTRIVHVLSLLSRRLERLQRRQEELPVAAQDANGIVSERASSLRAHILASTSAYGQGRRETNHGLRVEAHRRAEGTARATCVPGRLT